MICPFKPVQTQPDVLPAIRKPFRTNRVADRLGRAVDRVVWSLPTAGPFMVPVTRWIE